MKWHDMAERSRELHPESRPMPGSCFRSDCERFTVALVNADPAQGWAIWYIGGPTMRLLASVPLARASQGMALAQLLGTAIRGVALVMRVRSLVRAARAAAQVVLDGVSPGPRLTVVPSEPGRRKRNG